MARVSGLLAAQGPYRARQRFLAAGRDDCWLLFYPMLG